MTDCKTQIVPICFWLPTDNAAVDEWALTASTEAANHPVGLVKLDDRNQTWRATTGGAQWIEGNSVIGFGAMTADSIVIVNHNAEDNVNDWHIECWNSLAEKVVDEYFIMNRYLYTNNPERIKNKFLYKNRVFHFPEPGFNIVRWRLSTLGRAAGVDEIGRIFFCSKFQPETTWDDAPFYSVDDTKLMKSDGANISAVIKPVLRGFDISIPRIDKFDVINMVDLIHRVGRRRPIFVDCNPILTEAAYEGASNGEREYFATKNLLWQVYGRLMSDMKISPSKGINFMTLPGELKIVEEG